MPSQENSRQQILMRALFREMHLSELSMGTSCPISTFNPTPPTVGGQKRMPVFVYCEALLVES